MTRKEIKKLKDQGVKAIVNLCAEYNGRTHIYKQMDIVQLHIPTVDMCSPNLESVEKAIKFISKETENKKGKVFIHCKMGMGRSATVALCHLIKNEGLDAEAACLLIKSIRPEVATKSIMKYPVVQEIIKQRQSVQQLSPIN